VDGQVDGGIFIQEFTNSGSTENTPRVAFQAPASSPGGFAYGVGSSSGVGTYKILNVTPVNPTGLNGAGQAMVAIGLPPAGR